MGFRVDFHFETTDAVLRALSPMLDKWVEGDKPTFTLERPDQFSVNVNARDGFQFAVEPSKIAVVFRHTMKMKTMIGGPPVAELLSHPLPYTVLLPQVAKHLMDTTLLLCAGSSRKITRIGVVATAVVDTSVIPPGMARFVTYMGRPWKGLVDYYTIQITSALAEDSRWSDRCMHTLSKSEDDPEQLIRLNFDWQRTFKTGHAITSESMKELVKHAEDSAMEYFEALAEGNQFDEELIREAT